MVQIIQIDDSRKLDYKPLLLIGDEYMPMIERYLWRGTMLALLDDGEEKAVAVVTDEGNGVFEIKNIAVRPGSQRSGYGSALIEHIKHWLKGKGHTLIVGTGDTPRTIGFYEKNGFERFRTVKDFFKDNYPFPIYDDGMLLCNMIYLKQDIR